MYFSLRNIFFGILGIFFVISLVFLYIISIFFYQNFQNEIVKEKEAKMRSVAVLLFGEEGSPAIETLSLPSIHRLLAISGSAEGVQFFRVIDSKSGLVVLSSKLEEENTIVVPIQPKALNKLDVHTTGSGKEAVVDLIYATNPEYTLWLRFDRAFYSGHATLITIQEGFPIFTLLLFLGVVFYVVGKSFIIDPLMKIQGSLLEIGKGKFETRLPDGPPNEFGVLFKTFNTMAEQVELARERDETLSKMKSDFISTAAHQLRTPLSGIRWAISGLLGGDFGKITDDQKKIVEGIEGKNTELIGIVKTLLDTVSVEQGAFGFEFQDIQIEKEIETSVHELEYRARKAGLSLVYKKEGVGGCPTVSADVTRIRWVVNNLVENSLHYTPVGGHITVTLSYNSENVTITIADTGIGIPQDELQFLFNRFFRGKKATKMRNDGNGLGLYIAKNIIDKHNGKIWAESVEGKGSTFYILLPVKKSA